MKNTFRLLLFLLVCAKVSAQYTDIINSNRPGYTENAYSVGKKIFQVENGVSTHVYSNINTTTKIIFQNDVNLRFGLLSEKLEINLASRYAYVDEEVKHLLEPSRIGVKYVVYDHKIKNNNQEIRSWKKRTAFNWSKLIPTVAIETRYTYRPNKQGYKGISTGILMHNHLNAVWNILTNIRYDGVNSEYEQYIASMSSNYSISQSWSSFVESYNTFSKIKNSYEIGGGFAYLVNKNLQLDVSTRARLSDKKTALQLALGFSWRLDRHKDKFEATKGKKTIIDEEQKPYTKLSKDRNSVQKKTPIGAINRNIFQKNKNAEGSKNKRKKPKRGKNLSKEIKNKLQAEEKKAKQLQKEILKDKDSDKDKDKDEDKDLNKEKDKDLDEDKDKDSDKDKD